MQNFRVDLIGSILLLICPSALVCPTYLTDAVDLSSDLTKTAAPVGELTSSTSTWNTLAPSPVKRFEAQGLVADGKLYIFGGFVNSRLQATRRSDVYEPTTNRWRRIADMPEALTHSAVVASGQTVYLIGGYVGNHPGPSTSHVWKYSIRTNTWSRAPSLPAPRGAGAAARLGQTLHFFGGANRKAGQVDHGDEGDHYVLFLDGGTSWKRRASIPNPRNHLGGTELGGKIYAIGGQHGRHEDDSNQSQVDAYNPVTHTWKRVANLPMPRGHVSASTFVLNKHIFVIGGTTNGGLNGLPATDVTSYNAQTNVWVKHRSLPAGRKSPVAGVIGNQVIVTTGNATGGATPTNTTWTRHFP